MTLAVQRQSLIMALSFATGLAILSRWPFPERNALLDIVLWHEPLLWSAIRNTYIVMCFTTPYIAFSVLTSLAYIFSERLGPEAMAPALPPILIRPGARTFS